LIAKTQIGVAEAFFDTNVLLYLIASDIEKATRTEALLAEGGVISVQVLNEFSNVALRKHGLAWSQIHGALAPIRYLCRIEPIRLETYDRAMMLCERYGYSVYDATILASALLAGCSTVYSEDLQHGQIIDAQLTIRNPYL